MNAAERAAINMTMAYLIALGSKDQRTKLGAVIVGPDDEIRSTGFNSFPRGLNDDLSERQEQPEKDFWFEHAERNAIYNAVRIGVSLKGCTLFTQRVPCEACARAIVQAGIDKVVIHQPWTEDPRDDVPRSHQIFAECRVELEIWAGELLAPIGWRRGEPI